MTMTRIGDVCSDVRKVSGGRHKESGREWEIKITIDYSNMTRDQLIDRVFSKDVISLQNNTLRNSFASVLDNYVETGYECMAEDIGTGKKSTSPIQALMGLGLTKAQAETVYNDEEKWNAAKAAIKVATGVELER